MNAHATTHAAPKARRAPTDGGLAALLRNYLREAQWSRVETGALSPGLPDIEGCWRGVSAWVELKRTEAGGRRVKVRPLQVAWHLRRSREGGRSFILVRRQHLGHDDLLLYAGHQAAELKTQGCTLMPLRAWEGGPGRWAWVEVAGAMFGP